jgi:hypothetical protein
VDREQCCALEVEYTNHRKDAEEEKKGRSEVYSKVKTTDPRCGGTWDDEQFVYHTHHDTCVAGLAPKGADRVGGAKATVPGRDWVGGL